MTAYAEPMLRRPMGLPIMAGSDTAWNRTRMSVVTPQALRCCATRETKKVHSDLSQGSATGVLTTHRRTAFLMGEL
jgi:hypothetical protein